MEDDNYKEFIEGHCPDVSSALIERLTEEESHFWKTFQSFCLVVQHDFPDCDDLNTINSHLNDLNELIRKCSPAFLKNVIRQVDVRLNALSSFQRHPLFIKAFELLYNVAKCDEEVLLEYFQTDIFRNEVINTILNEEVSLSTEFSIQTMALMMQSSPLFKVLFYSQGVFPHIVNIAKILEPISRFDISICAFIFSFLNNPDLQEGESYYQAKAGQIPCFYEEYFSGEALDLVVSMLNIITLRCQEFPKTYVLCLASFLSTAKTMEDSQRILKEFPIYDVCKSFFESNRIKRFLILLQALVGLPGVEKLYLDQIMSLFEPISDNLSGFIDNKNIDFSFMTITIITNLIMLSEGFAYQNSFQFYTYFINFIESKQDLSFSLLQECIALIITTLYFIQDYVPPFEEIEFIVKSISDNDTDENLALMIIDGLLDIFSQKELTELNQLFIEAGISDAIQGFLESSSQEIAQKAYNLLSCCNED